jgi:hypothetical protein
VELAGSLVALVNWFERQPGCESTVLSSFKSTRPPPLIGMPHNGLLFFSTVYKSPHSGCPSPAAEGCSPWRHHRKGNSWQRLQPADR